MNKNNNKYYIWCLSLLYIIISPVSLLSQFCEEKILLNYEDPGTCYQFIYSDLGYLFLGTNNGVKNIYLIRNDSFIHLYDRSLFYKNNIPHSNYGEIAFSLTSIVDSISRPYVYKNNKLEKISEKAVWRGPFVLTENKYVYQLGFDGEIVINDNGIITTIAEESTLYGVEEDTIYFETYDSSSDLVSFHKYYDNRYSVLFEMENLFIADIHKGNIILKGPTNQNSVRKTFIYSNNKLEEFGSQFTSGTRSEKLYNNTIVYQAEDRSWYRDAEGIEKLISPEGDNVFNSINTKRYKGWLNIAKGRIFEVYYEPLDTFFRASCIGGFSCLYSEKNKLLGSDVVVNQAFQLTCVSDDEITDKDGDGFDNIFDCNDEDPYINPLAYDYPFNGIDENCDCEDSDEITSIDKHLESYGFYPNPVADLISFQSNKNKKVFVYDSSGRMIISKEATSSISVFDLDPGLYYLQYIVNDKSTEIMKFIKI